MIKSLSKIKLNNHFEGTGALVIEFVDDFLKIDIGVRNVTTRDECSLGGADQLRHNPF